MSHKLQTIGLSWILLTSTASVIRWPHLPQQTTATATAFSLASIFPRRTEQNNNNNIHQNIVDPRGYRDAANKNHDKKGDNEGNPSGATSAVASLLFSPATRQQQQQQHHQQQVNGDNKESVHLQLQSTATATVEETPKTKDQPPKNTNNHKKDQPKWTRVKVHTYRDPKTKKTWTALNTSRRKFLAFLEYNNATDIRAKNESSKNRITTTTVSLPEPGCEENNNRNAAGYKYRNEWRALWKARQLLTDRTELLAVYQSDRGEDSKNLAVPKKTKRGGFADLLNLYTNRLVAILSDEQQDEQTPLDERFRSKLTPSHLTNRYGQAIPDVEDYVSHQSDHRILVKWLEENYGRSETQMIQASRFHTLPVHTQLDLMQHFMDWFRNHFPYYYDRCDACGASRKDDLASQPPPQASDNTCNSGREAVNNNEGGDEDNDDDNGTFLGYVYPNEMEVKGKASRTELYHCHRCGSFTRFPRFNSALDIIQSKRGRCGEYSLLLYRFLRALNHDSRWVVDWADHVWAEVLIGGNNHDTQRKNGAFSANGKVANNYGASSSDASWPRWIHLDPCEAAVDKPLLYEEWGKKQTFILALYAPLRYQTFQRQYRSVHNGYSSISKDGLGGLIKAPLVEDVTCQYTTDSWENICKRRDESEEEVESAIQAAIADLEEKLLKSEKLTSAPWSRAASRY